MERETTPRTPSNLSPEPVEIHSVKSSQPSVMRLLGKIRGMMQHWNGKRSVACRGDGDCLPARHKTQVIWKGYVAAQLWSDTLCVWSPTLLEVTEALEELLRGRKLRGEVWKFVRKGKGKKTDPVSGIFCEKQGESVLSPEFDVYEFLKRFFREPSFPFDLPNPLTRKLILPAVAGPAPVLPPDVETEQPIEQSPAERKSLIEMMKEQVAKQSHNGSTVKYY